MNYLQAIILGIVEGLTEFLPVSSTGHLIIASSFLGLNPEDPFVQLFIVAIQLGTILSVVVLYFKRFFKSVDFYFKLFVAFIPAVVLGLLLDKYIEKLLGSVTTVAIMLIVGGMFLLFIEKLFKNNTIEDTDKVSYLSGFKIGIWQCLAMMPGVSRSAASIIGGMQQKLSKKAAAEFSFFLAVPTMFGATAKKFYDFYKTSNHQISIHEWQILGVGNVVGFIVAIVAIKSFINYVSKHGFQVFGLYRIVVGVVILILIMSGHSLQMM